MEKCYRNYVKNHLATDYAIADGICKNTCDTVSAFIHPLNVLSADIPFEKWIEPVTMGIFYIGFIIS